jgi:hypothetical protein
MVAFFLTVRDHLVLKPKSSLLIMHQSALNTRAFLYRISKSHKLAFKMLHRCRSILVKVYSLVYETQKLLQGVLQRGSLCELPLEAEW